MNITNYTMSNCYAPRSYSIASKGVNRTKLLNVDKAVTKEASKKGLAALLGIGALLGTVKTMDSTKPLSEIPARTGDERIKTNPIKKRIFAQEDIEKMKNMSEDEALEYKRKLVKLGKYNEIDIRV